MRSMNTVKESTRQHTLNFSVNQTTYLQISKTDQRGTSYVWSYTLLKGLPDKKSAHQHTNHHCKGRQQGVVTQGWILATFSFRASVRGR